LKYIGIDVNLPWNRECKSREREGGRTGRRLLQTKKPPFGVDIEKQKKGTTWGKGEGGGGEIARELDGLSHADSFEG
jgi:hypothetical protein